MKEQTIRLLEIERFAIHDGPGIRTVVFLQGCPLRCPWCANPESQIAENHLLYYEKKCLKCGNCINACPHGYIAFKNDRLTFDKRNCTDCSLCVEACPQNAIKIAGMDMPIDNVMKVILRDKDYYLHSGGGVTFSGGEALMQIESLLMLLKACKKEGIHTAIETCGQVSSEHIKRALPWVDLFLFDIKHMNTEKLRQTVKGNIKLIMENLSLIAQENSQKIVIRIPCIPDFNFSDTFMGSVFQLAQDLHIYQINLLPYHTLGKDKYLRMGLQYPYREQSLEKENLIPYRDKGEQVGLNVYIE